MREIKEWYWDEEDCEFIIKELEDICKYMENSKSYDGSIKYLEDKIIECKLSDDSWSINIDNYIINECIIASSMLKIGCDSRCITKKIKSDINWFYNMVRCIHIYGYVR